MTCRLAPGRVHNTLSRPRAASLTDRTEQDAAPRGFLTGRSLIYTKEGRTEALQGSTCVSSSGLWAGALCWKLGVTYGEYHTPGAENAHASPSTHLVSSPQDASLPGRRLCSSQQAAEPWPGTAGARPGEQRCHGLWPGSCGAARHPCPTAPTPCPARQAPGKSGTGPWGRSPTSCPRRCSVLVPSLPTHLLPVLATEQHSSPGNTRPSGGGGKQGGQGPWPPTLAPRFHHRCCSHSECRTERCLRHSTASQPGLVSSRHSTARGRGAVTSRLCDAGWRLPAGCSSCDALHRGRCLHHSNAEQWNGLGRKGQ